MKEFLGCNQCEDIICADTLEDRRLIGQSGQINEGRWVIFPENVEDCKLRKPKVVFDNMMGWQEHE